jgi:quinol monooxygenase YgiN
MEKLSADVGDFETLARYTPARTTNHHEDTMAGLTVMARAKAKPGREAELEQAMRAVVVPTHQEAGCLRYTVYRSVIDPSVFVTVEHWMSKEAVDQHFATAHVQALLKQVPNLLMEPPDITLYELLPEGDSEKGRL